MRHGTASDRGEENFKRKKVFNNQSSCSSLNRNIFFLSLSLSKIDKGRSAAGEKCGWEGDSPRGKAKKKVVGCSGAGREGQSEMTPAKTTRRRRVTDDPFCSLVGGDAQPPISVEVLRSSLSQSLHKDSPVHNPISLSFPTSKAEVPSHLHRPPHSHPITHKKSKKHKKRPPKRSPHHEKQNQTAAATSRKTATHGDINAEAQSGPGILK